MSGDHWLWGAHITCLREGTPSPVGPKQRAAEVAPRVLNNADHRGPEPAFQRRGRMFSLPFHKALTGNLLFNLVLTVTSYLVVATKIRRTFSAEHKHHAVTQLKTEPLQENHPSIHELNPCYLGSESWVNKYG